MFAILVIIVMVVTLLYLKRQEYFTSKNVVKEVMDGIKEASEKNTGLDEFRLKTNMPKFSAYTFGVLMHEYEKGEMTEEKTSNYLMGDF